MKKYLFCFISVCLGCFYCFAQSSPIALKPNIQISRLASVRNGAIRFSLNPLTHHFFYNVGNGNIYEIIFPASGPAYDTLRYTSADHGVEYPQCIAFYDSVLFVSGNNHASSKFTSGIISKGVLQANGTRLWTTVMETEVYPTADYFDHLFSGMVLSPQGDSITICSGSRGDHGEIESRYGYFPGTRNVPLTTVLFRVPTNSYTFLYNDSLWLSGNSYVFAKGVRNTFSMAYDANNNLFGVENSCGRDHHEEMNWLRRGKHYGFPYKMGDTDNPQQFASYNPFTDFMISHYNASWRIHAWANDPTFPPAPAVIFEEPIQNLGPDCDKFRDTITGTIMDASDLGRSIGTFTAHRSPLGLVFDKDSSLAPTYCGDAFMLSWSVGLDSCGCTAVPDSSTGPFVDPSEDLVHLHLMYDSIIDNFYLNAERIVGAFSNPVDAVMDSNYIYVLENGYSGTSGFYKITLPPNPVGVSENKKSKNTQCFPNPAKYSINIGFALQKPANCVLHIYNTKGQVIVSETRQFRNEGGQKFSISCKNFENGIYTYSIQSNESLLKGKFIVAK